MTDPSPPDQTRWVDVHEAAATAGVSVTSIRNWYRGPDPEIPSRMERGDDGRQRRVMPLEAVVQRAARARSGGGGAPTGQGKPSPATRRPSKRSAGKRAKPAKATGRKATGSKATGRKASGSKAAGRKGTAKPAAAAQGADATPPADRTRRRSMAKKTAAQSSRRGRTARTRRERAQSQTIVPAPTATAEALPEGSLPVPVTAWDRMLSQLGNLHEMGRELAAAEARAARAETEARFHADRVGELRGDLESLRSQVEALEAERDEARRDAEEARRQRDAAHTDHERTRIDRDHVQRQLDEARREHQEFTQALQASREMDTGKRRWFS
jgi:hypothetical protein